MQPRLYWLLRRYSLSSIVAFAYRAVYDRGRNLVECWTWNDSSAGEKISCLQEDVIAARLNTNSKRIQYSLRCCACAGNADTFLEADQTPLLLLKKRVLISQRAAQKFSSAMISRLPGFGTFVVIAEHTFVLKARHALEC